MSGAIPGDASGVSLIEQFILLFNNLSPIRAKKATCDMLSAFFLLFLHQQPARCCYSVAGPCVWVHIINLNSYEKKQIIVAVDAYRLHGIPVNGAERWKRKECFLICL